MQKAPLLSADLIATSWQEYQADIPDVILCFWLTQVRDTEILCHSALSDRRYHFIMDKKHDFQHFCWRGIHCFAWCRNAELYIVLITATLLTLVLVPLLYYWFTVQRKVNKTSAALSLLLLMLSLPLMALKGKTVSLDTMLSMATRNTFHSKPTGSLLHTGKHLLLKPLSFLKR
jgi:hypothetical protein